MKIKRMLCREWLDCYQASMGFCSGRLKIVAILVLLSGCAHAPPPAPVLGAAPEGPSPQALRNEYLKGYQAGFYEGRREQARRDRALFLPSTLPPPPPPGAPAVTAPPAAAAAAPTPAAAAPAGAVPAAAAPAVIAPVQAPPQSVFVPAGPAEPVTTNP